MTRDYNKRNFYVNEKFDLPLIHDLPTNYKKKNIVMSLETQKYFSSWLVAWGLLYNEKRGKLTEEEIKKLKRKFYNKNSSELKQLIERASKVKSANYYTRKILTKEKYSKLTQSEKIAVELAYKAGILR